MEVWPSGHADDYKNYIANDNGVVDGGQLGVVGQIGWWFPTYMLQDHPELQDVAGPQAGLAAVRDAEHAGRGNDPRR